VQHRIENVWQWPVRIAHWLLASLVIINLFNDHGGKLHRYIGYVAVAAVVLRLLYGVIGPAGPARLHLPRPRSMWLHARAMLAGVVPRPAGHNPLGAAMTLLLWLLVLLLGLTGWVSRWDRFWGEDWPQDLHAVLACGLQGAVLLHLAGVVLSSALERQNLVKAMVTGRKRVDMPVARSPSVRRD
jgi:cytochrome b